MRRRRIIWAVAGLGLAALIVVLAFPREREPEYQGRTLSEWLKLYLQPGSFDRFTDGQEAADAVRHIGTNALPWLLKWTDYEPSGWEMMLLTNAPAATRRLGFVRSLYVRLLHRRAGELDWLARSGFEILGPLARPALPELERRMANWQKPYRASVAMESYTNIERAGSVPVLARALVSTNAYCRLSAAFCLVTLGTNAAPAAPALSNALSDPDAFVRKIAGVALKKTALQTTNASAGR